MLWLLCLLCLSTPGAALRSQESARPSGARLQRDVEARLEEALSNLTPSSADWEAVYLRSLRHLSKYAETFSQRRWANLKGASRREKQDWPHIIHQTAKDPDHLNGVFKASRASWTSTFPSWSYHLWSDDDMNTFMQEHYPSFMQTWQNYPRQIMRIDAVRYFWLDHFGGIYADMDLFALKDFSSLLAEHNDSEVIMGQLGQGFDPVWGGNCTLEIALMISKPKAAIWDHIISTLPQMLHHYCFHSSRRGLFNESTRRLMAQPGVVELEELIGHQVDELHQKLGFKVNPLCDQIGPGAMTGPNFFSQTAKFHEQGMAVVEPGVFYPIDWSTGAGQEAAGRIKDIASKNPEGIVPAMQEAFPNALTGTLWAHSWNDI